MFILQIWVSRNPLFMQAMTLCWGLGAFIVPTVTRPFLILTNLTIDSVDECVISSFELTGGTAMIPSYFHFNSTDVIDDTNKSTFSSFQTKLIFPYCIVSLYSFISGIIFLMLWWF